MLTVDVCDGVVMQPLGRTVCVNWDTFTLDVHQGLYVTCVLNRVCNLEDIHSGPLLWCLGGHFIENVIGDRATVYAVLLWHIK